MNRYTTRRRPDTSLTGIRANLPHHVFRRDPLGILELVEDVPVVIERIVAECPAFPRP
jgi:hypothetical protein